MTDRLFDPRALVAAEGSLFGVDDLEDLFAIADQATEQDRRAMRELAGRKESNS